MQNLKTLFKFLFFFIMVEKTAVLQFRQNLLYAVAKIISNMKVNGCRKVKYTVVML